jgi:hemolysin III
VSQSLLSSAHEPVEKPKPRLRGALHALVAIIAVPATVLLAVRARQGTPTRLALAYGAALILVFGTSGLYHMPLWPLATRRRMRRLDHSMIYLLIAGSYAPFALELDAIPRAIVLSIAIGGGLLGFIKAHAWERAPRVLTTGFYVLIGWCILPLLPQLYARIGLWRVGLLLLGGVLYTAGAVVYWLRRPNPWPRTFGYHEVNHAIGVIGAVAHYVAIWNLLT